MSKETTINEIKELQRQIEEKKKSLRPLFESGLQEIFAKYPDVTKIEVRVNNHEFNDGEETFFRLYYDDLDVHFSNGSSIGGWDGESGDDVPSNGEAIADEFSDFFGQFDVDDFFEEVFGDEDSSIEFLRK